ncbi:Uu.00g068760.m01.CDS01 [Anthostomella pinea]|uniref:alcohol dehydrogenase (NADP(+)) n=1 Tax=Anthostomella pinea TaxID=933095 RepID=A0AAI8VUE7_9PEZI|nr:Uu.00g068760.m01.CDS01 [Anthostomella pinea]
MAATDYKFKGWNALDATAAEGKMVWREFEPKRWEENDVDIKITHAGICGSDIHTLRSGWGETAYPCVVGHEIVGTAVKVGSKVEGIKVGDRVGVGAQSDSCLGRFGDCEDCAAGDENYCDKVVGTYNSKHFNGDASQGGYATYHRSPSHFVIKIPDGVPSQEAAPMMCGGVTVYAPLKNYNVGPGMTVGIVGVGGLGHYGVKFASALGAKVVGISRKEAKRGEVLELGAADYIATDDNEDWVKKHYRSLDLIISTVASSKVPINDYFQLLKKKGNFVQVGIPEDGAMPIAVPSVVFGQKKFTGSLIGSPANLREMLELVARNNLRGMIQERPMKDANQAIVDLEAGKARYRYVLFNEDAA